MSMKIGFSEEELKPHGKYLPFDGKALVRVKTIEYRTSQAGNQVAKFGLVGIGDHAGMTGNEEIPVMQTTKFKLQNFFEAAGFSKEQLMAGPTLEELIEKVVVLSRKKTGEKQGKNGKTYSEWKFHFEKPTADQMILAGDTDATAAPAFTDEEDVAF